MGPPEQAVLGRTAAGEQKQGHVDAEGGFKPFDHVHGLTEPAGADGQAQALPWLVAEGAEQVIEAVIQQGFRRCHAANVVKAEIQAFV